MRTIFWYLFLAAFLLSSCRKDPIKGCTDATALNYTADAEKDDGKCSYERDKFLGNYIGTQSCAGGTEPDFGMEITRALENTNRILLSNYPLSGSSLYGQIDSDPLRFIIPPQPYVVELDSSYISGTGALVADSLRVQIYWESSSGLDTCITKVRKIN